MTFSPLRRLSSSFVFGTLVLAAALLCGSEETLRGEDFNYDEAAVVKYDLPALLIAADGTQIDSSEKWEHIRRPELLHLFEEHVFGTLPPAVHRLRVRKLSSDTALEGKALRREMTVFFSDNDNGPQMNLLIYTPQHSESPVPCFLGLNFGGNQTLEKDPRIQMTRSWVRNDAALGITANKATEESRGSAASRWPLDLIISSGYGLATAYYGDIDPDFDDNFQNGIHQLFVDQPARTGSSGGSISAWAWGLSRALDILQQDQQIDGSRVAVIGHSRLGKTVLWAGATDPRFAMVISNNSGCGGAALSRRNFGETVARINTSFPHWFCINHRRYNNNEQELPVDHHMLIALAAPRPVYVASAEEDRWADPRGEMLGAFHAGPAYQLYGKSPLSSDAMPAVNSPVMHDVGYHLRTGKHDINEYDWKQYIQFADKHLRD
jgi:hypothetical protein